jgi:hypothetical protein
LKLGWNETSQFTLKQESQQTEPTASQPHAACVAKDIDHRGWEFISMLAESSHLTQDESRKEQLKTKIIKYINPNPTPITEQL